MHIIQTVFIHYKLKKKLRNHKNSPKCQISSSKTSYMVSFEKKTVTISVTL